MNSKIMVQRLIQVQTSIVARRNLVVATYPRNRISLGEKLAHGLAIFFGVTAIPVWVVTHMREYREHGGTH